MSGNTISRLCPLGMTNSNSSDSTPGQWLATGTDRSICKSTARPGPRDLRTRSESTSHTLTSRRLRSIPRRRAPTISPSGFVMTWRKGLKRQNLRRAYPGSCLAYVYTSTRWGDYYYCSKLATLWIQHLGAPTSRNTSYHSQDSG